jgi:hypothetical protein
MLPRPVIEEPGDTPRSPVMVVGPVLVTVEPPRTAKLVATPSDGAVPIALTLGGRNNDAVSTTTDSNDRETSHLLKRILITLAASTTIKSVLTVYMHYI